jgi:hypothetical protein
MVLNLQVSALISSNTVSAFLLRFLLWVHSYAWWVSKPSYSLSMFLPFFSYLLFRLENFHWSKFAYSLFCQSVVVIMNFSFQKFIFLPF